MSWTILPPLALDAADYDPSPVAPALRTMTLRRKRCAGGAPYVGDLFFYEWDVLVDDLGRYIAGDSRIVYRPVDQ